MVNSFPPSPFSALADRNADALPAGPPIPAEITSISIEGGKLADAYGSLDSSASDVFNGIFEFESLRCTVFGDKFTNIANFTVGSVQDMTQNGEPTSITEINCQIAQKLFQ